MFNVLVVDDEPRHRRGLVNIIRKLRPDFQIDEAMNGQEAMEVIRRAPAHIIITDIRMPVMDGFEFLDKLDPESGNIKVVIITAYRDFEYAKKAIHFRVFDYILKPVEVEAVEQTLRKVESKIVEELNERSRTERLLDKLDHTQTIFLEHQLNKELEGLLSPEAKDRLDFYFNLRQAGLVLYVELIEKGYNPNVETFLYEQIKGWHGWGTCVPFFLKDSKEQMAILLQEEKKCFTRSELDVRAFAVWLQEWMGQIFEETGCRMTIGIGRPCSDLSKEWVKSFKQAWKNGLKGFFQGHGSVYLTEKNDEAKEQELTALLEDFASGMEQAFNDMNGRQAQDVLKQFCEKLPPTGEIAPARIKEAFMEVLAGPFKRMRFLMEEEQAARWEADMLASFNVCFTLEMTRWQAELWLSDILHRMDRKHSHKMDHTMEACKAYIAENYMRDLSLDEVAGRFHFNPSYFSNQFKQFAGVNFSDYIMQLRMGGALRLLETTNEKVYKVAQIVGYQDAKYFGRLFKKKMGTTPEQYRTLYISNRSRVDRRKDECR